MAAPAQSHHTYRWGLNEYLTRFEFSAINELIVEGSDDRRFYGDFVASHVTNDVDVYDADFLEVSGEEVERAGFHRGVKGRLLTLGAALSARADTGPVRGKSFVVVDRDYDPELDPTSRLNQFVLQTDGHSVESYALDADSLERFARNVLGRGAKPPGAGGRTPESPIDGTGLLERVRPAAVEMGAVRLSLLAWGQSTRFSDDWKTQIKVDPAGFSAVDGERVLRDVLKGREHDPSAFAISEQIADQRTTASSDISRWVRGHDFVAVLHKVLKGSWAKRGSGISFGSWDEEVVNRLVVTHADQRRFKASSLGVELQSRLA
jgi:hypothetical protein